MTMSFGKMNTFISIVEKQFTQDDEGFKTETDVTVAEVRAYREGRHGSEKWANMATYSTATERKPPRNARRNRTAKALPS